MYGIDYVAARDFGNRFGLAAAWSVPQKRLRLKSAWTQIEFADQSIEATLNGVQLFLSEPIVLRDGQLYLSRGDADQLFAPILAPVASRIPALKTIVIDAGHGGSDPGNQNHSLKLDEKVFTLDVARRLQRLLAARGYRVIMTRSSDRAVDLDRRTAIANKNRADLFISIHFNAFSDPSISGSETFVMTPHRLRSSPQAEHDRSMQRTRYPSNDHDRWNALLGYRLQRSLTQNLHSPDRGLKRFRFSVLRSIECPAVLVEAAFLSNPTEAHRVQTAEYRQRIAEAIVTGVGNYRTALDALRRRRGKSG
jgi:N-acetylmuramoyl-L-alanine amidase